MKLSLITVCYQAAPLLEETLQSALKQTFHDFELVIVDGGSTDNTLKVLEPFREKIGTLISEKDKGIYDAMNKGIAAAKGEYVYFLNAGDAFYHEKVLEEVFSNPAVHGADFIYAKVETRNEPTGVNYLNGKPVTFSMFYSHYPICHQATFTKRILFEKYGLFDLRFPLVADSEWFIRIFKDPAVSKVFIDKTVAWYDIQGATYHKRMKGYREYIHVSFIHFPLHIAIMNLLLYPAIWLKVWIIRTFQQTAWFKKYRQMKFNQRLAAAPNKAS